MLPVAGRMLERYSARWLFTGASVLNGVALCLMGMMSTLWGFYAVGARSSGIDSIPALHEVIRR